MSIDYYIHKARNIAELYWKWLSEGNNADKKLAKLLEGKDKLLRNLVYQTIERRPRR